MSYAGLYARLINATGWTFAQVDDLFWWQVNMLLEGWLKFPPLPETFWNFIKSFGK